MWLRDALLEAARSAEAFQDDAWGTDVVALLADLPAQRLARGQVGTVVEQLDDKTLLMEFRDGR